jgi:hypothetical protein
MTIKIDSRKVIFFLFVYYLCFEPILYMVKIFYPDGRLPVRGTSILALISSWPIVLLLIIFLIFFSKINVSKYLNFHSGCALLLYIWICFIVLVSYFDIGLIAFKEYCSYSNLIIGRGLIFILLGLNITVINDIFQSKKYCLLFYTITIIYFSVILLSSIYNPLAENDPWYLCGITRYTEDTPLDIVFDYHFISNTCALLLLCIMSQVKNIYFKLSIIVLGLFFLTLTCSRACLICFFVSGIVTCTIHFSKAGIVKIGYLTSIIILLIFLSIIYIPLLLDQMEDTDTYRFLNMSSFLVSDESYIGRKELLNKGLLELKETWLLGRYLSEVAEGGAGNYIHNWLSFLSAFGAGPFLLFVFLIVSAFYKIVKLFLKNSNSPIIELLFLWSIYMIILIAFSRSYTYYCFWFILLAIPLINHKFLQKSEHNVNVKLRQHGNHREPVNFTGPTIFYKK